MKKVFLGATAFISLLPSIFLGNVTLAESYPSRTAEKIVFFDVGENDDINSTLKKMQDMNCSCVGGKSNSLDINSLAIENTELLRIIDEIVQIDNDFQNWKESISFESMHIDVLHCVSKTTKAFNYWDYFFSNFHNKLLAIIIDVKNHELVEQNLSLRHGACVQNNYCLNDNNIILLIKNKDKSFIAVFFKTNIQNHYNKVQEVVVEKKKSDKKSVEKAF